MSSPKRMRERYAKDEDYRQRKLRKVQEARVAKRRESQRIKMLRGWQPIATAPDNEVVLIYDPDIFWPIVAQLIDDHWKCIHYQGPEPRPTHWRHVIEIPLA